MDDDRLFADLAALRPRLEQMLAALPGGTALGDLPGWMEFVHRPAGLLRVDGVPVLVATLYGPSGAGKSTLFRLLTGVEVPAGAERRPTTFGCVVAVPAEVRDRLDLAETFPGYAEVRELDRPERLADPDLPDGLLYVAEYPVRHSDSAVALIADVPDINTVRQDNWQRAEQMLARSEVVVFVCGPESYSDDRSVRQFEQCCRVAGYVAYVFTKCTRREAEIKWEHLREIVEEDLAKVAVFHSEFAAEPTLAGVRPLFTEQDLPDVLQGADALAIRMASMRKQARLAMRSLREVAEEARERERELKLKTLRIEEACVAEAERVAQARQPVQEVLEIILDRAKGQRPGIVNRLLTPVTLVSKGLRKAFDFARGLVAKPGRDVKEREAMEREQLAVAGERLIDVLRALDRNAVDAETAARTLREFLGRQPPEVSKDWEEAIQDETDRWVEEHPRLLHVVALLYDGLLAAGGVAIGVDLGISGGLIFSMGTSAAVGAGMMGGSKLLRFLVEKLGLGRVLATAHDAWLRQRRGELADHLREGLADPLLAESLRRGHAALAAANPEECLERLRGLERRQ